MADLGKLFHHVRIDNSVGKTLFLLHGTGGSAKDFLFLNDALDKKYNLVGLEGNINEKGMTRFFARTSPGVFDQESIKKESEKIHLFLVQWRHTYAIKASDMYFLGYSNGANMLLATLFTYPEDIRHAVLLHPMLPFMPKSKTDLSTHTIFASHGLYDEMISELEKEAVIQILKSRGAHVTHKRYASGHELSQVEIRDVCEYLK